MTKLGFLIPLAAAAVLLSPWPEKASAQGQFAVITGAQFDAAAPDSITLEGKKMPVVKNNAALVQSPGGTRAFLALLDTSGYSSDVATKYAGMVLATGGSLSIGGKTISAGTYGFGWAVPPRGEDGPGKFTIYTQAGAKLAEVATQRDAELKTPMPLQVIVLKNGTARLYHGRHSVELR